MKKILKAILIILIIAFVAIQFIRPLRNADPEIASNQITATTNIPPNVQQILKVSCYDCHSNTTHYPWYSNIQPPAWILSDHIIEGKKELNFSTFATSPASRRYKKFKEIGEQVKDGEMPLFSYILVHRDAALTAEEKSTLENWAANSMKEMEAKYPADSLKQRK